MKNLINEKPSDELHWRTLFNLNFIDEEDIKNKKILDIGCWFGWLEYNLLQKWCKNIVWIELTQDWLATAQEYIQNKNAEFKVWSAIDLPFPDQSFDTVISREVIEHIPPHTEAKMFEQAYRVLKPWWSFYLSTPFDNLTAKIFDPAWILIWHRHYDEKFLKDLWIKTWFEISKITKKWWLREIIWINNLYICKWIFRTKPFFKRFIDQKQDQEFQKDWFTNIFIKYIKI